MQSARFARGRLLLGKLLCPALLATAACTVPNPEFEAASPAPVGPALERDARRPAPLAADAGPVAEDARLRDAAPIARDAGPPAVADAAPPDSSAPDQQILLDDWVEVCKVTSHLNLRAGPASSFAAIASLPPGARARVLQYGASWTQLDWQGLIGWCYAPYLCSLAGNAGGGAPVSPGGGPAGAPLGPLQSSYAWLLDERDYPAAANASLTDAQCQPLAKVSRAFADALCATGSGRLTSGDVIRSVGSCACGDACPTGETRCYEQLPAQSYPWGKGASDLPRNPVRSLAVASWWIALDSTIYLRALDGFSVPRVGALGGFVHDGCFRVDLTGAGGGDRIEIFAGSKAMASALEQSFPSAIVLDAREGGERCAYFK